MCLINSLKVTSWDLNATSDLQTQLLFKDIQTKKKKKESLSHVLKVDQRDHYLSRLRFLHAVLGAGWPLTHFVSQKETQARHQCVGCLIHRRRGAQLLA